MAYRIAGDVLNRVAPPPPPGTPPQLVLAAVLAERHRRALARLRPARPSGLRGPAKPGAARYCATVTTRTVTSATNSASADTGITKPQRRRAVKKETISVTAATTGAP